MTPAAPSAPPTRHEAADTVTVVGLGKIGLPLAVQFATAGFRVLGADINPTVVDQVNDGIEPFPGETDLARRLGEVVRTGRLTATTDTAGAVARSGTVVIVVPLVVDETAEPDFAIVDAATAQVAVGLQPGTLVSYETTLPVGTTRTRLVPALVTASGLIPGEDLFVVMSPERVYSGRIFADLSKYPKLVGGLDPESTRRGVAFYERALTFDDRSDLPRPNGVWAIGSTEAAELVKLAETTYRDVNIALANTFAVYADSLGIDFSLIAEAANSQPFSHLHSPGVNVGGHCIPVYPRLYLSGDPAARLVATAREVNDAMPEHVVELLAERLIRVGVPIRDARVVILGAAYRGGVKETFYSGAFALARHLADRGAVPLVHDPLFTDAELRAKGLEPYHLGDRCDAAIVQADHADYREIGPADLPGVRTIVDGRATTDPERWQDVDHTVLGRTRATGQGGNPS
ncbi:nucleotide sugar dehydrogenase [Granulicoccus sp. GXG6511]|uniref:nucleotide sugar dehydrogenase n=1 Tax=Granulicoccus sp. GXG6511 TaxID=3381351 RepID=UPI003D7CF1AE